MPTGFCFFPALIQTRNQNVVQLLWVHSVIGIFSIDFILSKYETDTETFVISSRATQSTVSSLNVIRLYSGVHLMSCETQKSTQNCLSQEDTYPCVYTFPLMHNFQESPSESAPSDTMMLCACWVNTCCILIFFSVFMLGFPRRRAYSIDTDSVDNAGVAPTSTATRNNKTPTKVQPS